jgi:hypothetical protein
MQFSPHDNNNVRLAVNSSQHASRPTCHSGGLTLLFTPFPPHIMPHHCRTLPTYHSCIGGVVLTGRTRRMDWVQQAMDCSVLGFRQDFSRRSAIGIHNVDVVEGQHTCEDQHTCVIK